MSSAYSGRESASTRNPHQAAVPASANQKALAKMSTEERILAQWRAAFGSHLSDEAKAQFCITACGRTFQLSDVRLWTQYHPLHNGRDSVEKGIVHLEFFFDGTPKELEGHEDEFTKAFENMIEQQLQERRVVEFRKKLAARRRRGGGAEASRDECGEDGGGDTVDDEDWKRYLKTPVPKTDFTIRSYREAGCMLLFLVCQTSLSLSASECLGQVAFQEHFPIDGVAQEVPKSTKPLPKWVYGLGAGTATVSLFAVYAWWQVVRQFAFAADAGLVA